MSAFKDLAGQTFGRLTVVEVAERKNKEIHWLCRCECGQTVTVARTQLVSGKTKSCGCFYQESRTKHGHLKNKGRTPAYHSWQAMKARCQKPQHRDFPQYGGRGIKVCERWNDFENFLADLGEPEPGQTLDRIDTNGNYEPGNVRWATKKQQSNNRRNTVMLTRGSKTQSLADWGRELGISPHTISTRLKRGWTTKAALTPPDTKSD